MWRLTWLLLLSFSFMGLEAIAAGDAAKNDLKLFQGTWRAVSIQNPDGKQATPAELKEIQLVVKGHEFTMTSKDVSISGMFTIDSSKSPKTIDVTLANSKDPDERLLGVYEIQGDIRRSCFAMPKQLRPGSVRPPTKGFLMLEWKQVSAAP